MLPGMPSSVSPGVFYHLQQYLIYHSILHSIKKTLKDVKQIKKNQVASGALWKGYLVFEKIMSHCLEVVLGLQPEYLGYDTQKVNVQFHILKWKWYLKAIPSKLQLLTLLDRNWRSIGALCHCGLVTSTQLALYMSPVAQLGNMFTFIQYRTYVMFWTYFSQESSKIWDLDGMPRCAKSALLSDPEMPNPFTDWSEFDVLITYQKSSNWRIIWLFWHTLSFHVFQTISFQLN